MQIVALGIARGVILITQNIKEFKRVPDLQLEAKLEELSPEQKEKEHLIFIQFQNICSGSLFIFLKNKSLKN